MKDPHPVATAPDAPALPVIVTRLLAGEVRALARVITVLENGGAEAAALRAALYPSSGRALTVGITGPPGSGKSTLVDGLIRFLRDQGLTVAVLAVDPSSPYSGGAVLGDRIRMGGHADDRGVFIRSMGARGHLGGLARATDAALIAVEAAGWQVVIVETVGVGQSELEIATLASVTVVLLTPATGDAVQMLKAGLLEVADLLVVNKSDLPGAPRLVRDLRAMLAHSGVTGRAIVQTEATACRGIAELWAALQSRRAPGAQAAEERQRAIAARRVMTAALAALEDDLAGVMADHHSASAALLAEVAARTLDPATAAQRLLSWWRATRS